MTWMKEAQGDQLGFTQEARKEISLDQNGQKGQILNEKSTMEHCVGTCGLPKVHRVNIMLILQFQTYVMTSELRDHLKGI